MSGLFVISSFLMGAVLIIGVLAVLIGIIETCKADKIEDLQNKQRENKLAKEIINLDKLADDMNKVIHKTKKSKSKKK